MDEFTIINAVGMLTIAVILVSAVALLVRYRRKDECPDCRKSLAECRCQPGEWCCVGPRAGGKACKDAYDALLRAAALLEAAALYEGSTYRVGHFVGPIRITADSLLRQIDRDAKERLRASMAEDREVIAPFNANTNYQQEPRVIRVLRND